MSEIERERQLIADWLWKYANEPKWRYGDPNDEIRHFVGHAMDYIKAGWYLNDAPPASVEIVGRKEARR